MRRRRTEGGREGSEGALPRPPARISRSFVCPRLPLAVAPAAAARVLAPVGLSPLFLAVHTVPESEVYRVIKGNNCSAEANLEKGCSRAGNKTTGTPTVPANQSNESLTSFVCRLQYSELLNWLLEGEQPGSVRGLTGLVIKRPPCVVTCNSHPVSLNQHSKYSTFCIARGAGTHYKIQSPSESWMV